MGNLSISEQRTIQFYEFDYRLRGYYLSDTPVDIEPPYSPPFASISTKPYVDDGKVPSIFKQIGTLLSNPKQDKPQEKTVDLQAIPLSSNTELKGFSFSFPRGQEVSSQITTEFINQLSYTTTPISFEIIGTAESIIFQIVCDANDVAVIQGQLKGFYPVCNVREISVFDLGFDLAKNIGIVDFGLCNESMLPIKSVERYSLDPLTSFIATLDNLHVGETAMLQMMFKGVTAPFSYGMNLATSDGQNGSFFTDFPELPNQCKEKTTHPLFATVIRIVAQSNSDLLTNNLAQELIRNVTTTSTSQYNSLIPLSNKGYEYENGHLKNVYYRQSNRLGMLLSSKELTTYFHFPNSSVVSKKLHPHTGRTKTVKEQYRGNKYVLGYNEHNGVTEDVSITSEMLGRHLFISGSTGSGKTHALKQLIQQSIQEPNTANVVIDGHGDLANDLLFNIREEDREDIVFINIADEEYSFGFNIFSAESEATKGLLASDLHKVFQATFVSSGDRINSVLQKTISTFLYSQKEASVLDFRRFLLEQEYRQEYLRTIDDPILEYYWLHDFPLIKRHELSPLLLRIDSFLQTRLLRNFFALREGLDLSKLIQDKKTIIIQLSVGLIGLENSKFIANLLITKITQIAFSRASLPQSQRFPIRLFIDESHYYANNESIEHILSGARKYGLNLCLVGGQHLEQFDNYMLSSILSNTAIQIYFRQNDKDARRVASSFYHFETEDFMELGRGEALLKIDKRSNDCNIKTFPLEIYNEPKRAKQIRQNIIQSSQQKYATPNHVVQEIIKQYVPQNIPLKSSQKGKSEEVISKTQFQENKESQAIQKRKTEFRKNKETKISVSNFEQQKETYLQQANEQEKVRKHRASQNFVRTMALQRGFKVTFEQETNNGGRVDVALLKNDLQIAIEISHTNTVSYEVQNIEKCIADNFSLIYMISDNKQHLHNIEKEAIKSISKKHHSKLHFFQLEDLAMYLDATEPKITSSEKRIRGYRVQVNYKANNEGDKQKSITDIIMKALRQK